MSQAMTQKEIEWVLARARSMSLCVRLIQAEIDEIGISLKNGWITPERAANDLAVLERLPIYLASMFLSDQPVATEVEGAAA
jgi:hypothetical protein